MIKFLIWAPKYDDSSGGIIALHRLADLLTKEGEDAYLYSEKTFDGSSAKLITNNLQLTKFAQETTMVVYPEIIIGNPFHAKYVTRWLLNTPGVCGGDGIYDENDLIYKWIDYYKAPDESKVKGELRVLDLKLDKFVNRGEPRSGECYLVKKGRHKVQDKHKKDSLSIDKYISDEWLVDVFNSKEYLISYDEATFHLQQAVLCGCTPIVIPGEDSSEEDFFAKSLINRYGIAYGFDDIERAKSTSHLLKDYLISLENESVQLVKNYIKDCYEHMNLKKSYNN